MLVLLLTAILRSIVLVLVADGDELKNAVLRDDADGRARERGS